MITLSCSLSFFFSFSSPHSSLVLSRTWEEGRGYLAPSTGRDTHGAGKSEGGEGRDRGRDGGRVVGGLCVRPGHHPCTKGKTQEERKRDCLQHNQNAHILPSLPPSPPSFQGNSPRRVIRIPSPSQTLSRYHKLLLELQQTLPAFAFEVIPEVGR